MGEARRRRDAANGQPPSSNTGVLITKGALIHWMRFTLPLGREIAGLPESGASLALRVYEQLTGAAGETAPHIGYGYSGYSDGVRLPGDGAWICWNPSRPDMGVCVNLPGETLPLLPFDPKSLIAWAYSMGGHFTRLDVAVDTDQVHISDVRAAVERGDLVSRSQTQEYYGNFKTDAFTIYVGSRMSERFVRIYNKAAEQKVEGDVTWTRCEVEFKSEQAELAARYILADVDLRSLVFSAVDFRDRRADSNVKRCPQLTWWTLWIGSVDRVSFAVAKSLTDSVAKVYTWIQKQVAPSLSFLNEFFGGDSPWLDKICDAGRPRIPEHRWRLLDTEGAWQADPEPVRYVERVTLGSVFDTNFGRTETVAAFA